MATSQIHWFFSQKTKNFIGNTWKCIVSIGLASYSETKASSVGISKIFFDLNGLDPPREEPFFCQESLITLETTLLGCVHPQLCRHSPFRFQISRNYKSSFTFSGPPTLRPGRKGKLTTCLFLPAFLCFQHRLSVSLTALSLMKEAFESFSGGYINIYLVPLFETWACCQHLPRHVDPAPLRFHLF